MVKNVFGYLPSILRLWNEILIDFDHLKKMFENIAILGSEKHKIEFEKIKFMANKCTTF
jgi:hypothetical protein